MLMRNVQRTDMTRGLVVWSVLIGLLTLSVTIVPAVFLRTSAGDQTSGAGLGAFGLTLLVLSLIVPAPPLLAGLWLGGYGFWRGRMVAQGKRPSWSLRKVIAYLCLAVLSVYVLAFTAWNTLLASQGSA
jgi:hypothetical protein